jgi:hypothetical protein
MFLHFDVLTFPSFSPSLVFAFDLFGCVHSPSIATALFRELPTLQAGLHSLRPLQPIFESLRLVRLRCLRRCFTTLRPCGLQVPSHSISIPTASFRILARSPSLDYDFLFRLRRSGPRFIHTFAFSFSGFVSLCSVAFRSRRPSVA